MSWALANEIGYKPITTFWEDFSIAEKFGSRSIEETAERCFKEWKHDYKYLTELVMVLNHKSWYHESHRNKIISDLYSKLYYKYDSLAIEELKNNEEGIHYYFRTLD